MGKLLFDSSIEEFRYRASKTILRDSPFARKITEFIKKKLKTSLICCFLVTSEITSYFSRMTKKCILYLVNMLKFCLLVVF